MKPTWEGKGKAETTSKEALEIAPPKGRLVDIWRRLLEE